MLVFITAGDPSADEHAARLMAAMRTRIPNVVFEGFGGPAMELQGLRSVAHLRDLAVSGIWEVAKRIGYFRTLMKTCTTLMERRKPDLYIAVDYPGFNLRLARRAKALGVPVAWYIAPQLWAWGKDRAKKLASVVDLLMVVFPFEVDFFNSFGIRTHHVGHPLLDQLAGQPPAQERRGILLMPGSRHHEVAGHVPILVPVAREMVEGGFGVSVARARTIGDDELAPLTNVGATIVTNSREAMRTHAAGLIKAGTSTLEASVIGLPFATFYRTSWLSYTMGKQLVNVDSITMANLLLNEKVYKEFIQADAVPRAMAEELRSLATNVDRQHEMQQATQRIRELLGGSGAAERAAELIAVTFGKEHRI